MISVQRRSCSIRALAAGSAFTQYTVTNAAIATVTGDGLATNSNARWILWHGAYDSR